MEFHFSEPQTEFERFFGGHFCLNLSGRILPGDDKRFEEFLKSVCPPPRVPVYIHSLGGDVDAAIGIGRLIRDHWFSTSVGTYILSSASALESIKERELLAGKCMSAATLIFLGGRLRFLPEDAEFGVHQFSFKNPTPDHVGLSQTLSARIAQFVEDMGVRMEFLEVSSAIPGDKIQLLEHAQLRSMGVVTDGETDVQWSVQSRNGMMYVRGERDSLFGHHKVMLGFIAEAGFVFWAVIEAQGRERQLTGFGIIEIVLNGEAKRIDVSDRCHRQVVGNYVNVIAKLTNEEAAAIAFSDSFGVQIRFSIEAELFLGIRAMSTSGGRDQLQTFYSMLGR